MNKRKDKTVIPKDPYSIFEDVDYDGSDSTIAKADAWTQALGTAGNYAGSVSQNANAGKQSSYTQGILTGAASGAAIGTTINAGWGTLIGGVVGAAGGAIGTAVGNKKAREYSEPDDKDIREGLKLKNKVMKQGSDEKERETEWKTKLRNSFKYR